MLGFALKNKKICPKAEIKKYYNP